MNELDFDVNRESPRFWNFAIGLGDGWWLIERTSEGTDLVFIVYYASEILKPFNRVRDFTILEVIF